MDLFLTGGSLRVNAFAGAGKTSTLRLMASATGKRGVYLAFNRAIAEEAGPKFGASVTTQTLHSYAYRRVPRAFRDRRGKLGSEVGLLRLVDLLGLEPVAFSRHCFLTARMLAAVIQETVQRFCQSDAEAVERGHVPRWGGARRLSWWRYRSFAGFVTGHAARLWEMAADPASPVPLGHDGYLKLWALSRPEIPGDYILMDEAQDSSGVVIGLLARQAAQVIYVGDPHQQIYAWRGAVNAMARVRTRHRADLTRSFRFGPEIAAAATRIIRVLGERRRIEGNDAIPGRLSCADPQAVLCRTNSTLFAAVGALAGERKVAVLGGTGDLSAILDDVERLQQDRRALRAGFFGFRRWSEVVRASEEEDGAEFRGLVNLVRRHRVTGLRGALQVVVPEAEAEVIVSTVHKAKGREWARVRVADDFSPFRHRRGGRREIQPEDVRLFYVAVTRAREEVAIPRRLRVEFGIRRI